MEGMTTALTDKQQSLAWTVIRGSMTAAWAGLTGQIGVDPDHTAVVERRLIGDEGLKFGEGPTALPGVGFASPGTGVGLMTASDTFADMGQVFQSNQSVRMSVSDLPRDDMVSIQLEPSLVRSTRVNGVLPNECL